MSKDVVGLAFEVLGGLIKTIGDLVRMRDEDAARRALDKLKAHGRSVSADAVALEAARGVPRPDRDDS